MTGQGVRWDSENRSRCPSQCSQKAQGNGPAAEGAGDGRYTALAASRVTHAAAPPQVQTVRQTAAPPTGRQVVRTSCSPELTCPSRATMTVPWSVAYVNAGPG